MIERQKTKAILWCDRHYGPSELFSWLGETYLKWERTVIYKLNGPYFTAKACNSNIIWPVQPLSTMWACLINNFFLSLSPLLLFSLCVCVCVCVHNHVFLCVPACVRVCAHMFLHVSRHDVSGAQLLPGLRSAVGLPLHPGAFSGKGLLRSRLQQLPRHIRDQHPHL